MTVREAVCPKCGWQQKIVTPTIGWYRCAGCRARVGAPDYQLLIFDEASDVTPEMFESVPRQQEKTNE